MPIEITNNKKWKTDDTISIVEETAALFQMGTIQCIHLCSIYKEIS